MIYANAHQIKALLSIFSYSHTHDDIYAHKISHIQCIKTMQFAIRIYAYKILSYLYAYTHLRKRRLTRGRIRDFQT